jgi:heme a synthase
MRRLSIALAGLTFLLLIIGGLVSTTESGLACPDWPTCHGTFLPAMVGGVRFEYTHRAVATSVGLCTVILAILAWRNRQADRRLAWLALGAVGLVVFQGLLGAATVKLELPPPVSIAHLGTSMLFFSLTVAMAWRANRASIGAATHSETVSGWGRSLTLVATVAVYLQIVLGAVVRHTRSGLACTDLPLCRGALFPADGHLGVQLHMAHRLLGVIAGALLIAACLALLRARVRGPQRMVAMAAPLAVLLQIGLGAGIILTWRDLYVMTLHQALGAAILAMMVSLWVLSRRKISQVLKRPAGAIAPGVAEAQA